MALKQPNGAGIWTEPKGSGAAIAVTEMHVADNGAGYWVIRELLTGEAPSARLLDTGTGYFGTHEGADNPAAAAELRMIDVGPMIVPYA